MFFITTLISKNSLLDIKVIFIEKLLSKLLFNFTFVNYFPFVLKHLRLTDHPLDSQSTIRRLRLERELQFF